MKPIDRADFDALVDRAMQQGEFQKLRPVIEKELLHGDILFSLSAGGLLDDLVFQGGTSLRLCYGGSRFSEDLDFAGGVDFSSRQVSDIRGCIEDYLSGRYGLEVSVKEPASLKGDPQYSDLRIEKWQVSIITAPDRPDIPRQRIKLEIANIPAHTREVMPLKNHYDFLPDGYRDTLVPVESLREIMADKLISLPATERYVRHRDIWDLAWIAQQRTSIDFSLVARKVEDYRLTDYQDRLERMVERLPDIVFSEAFSQEMQRFLPSDVVSRTFAKPDFLTYLERAVSGQLLDVQEELYTGDRDSPTFSM